MVYVNKIKMTVQERAMLDNAIAKEETNAANLDYLAMMLDIEIPTEEEGLENE